ncbi:MerC domain-containing protein [Sediminibacterium ginsengisoli]|uniref:MerC mercury resistance protein n=1 Tax=Sediminibacterium ginsengisoli TaxID=413434 RepID=A0A1T4RTW7_9BACT|nr:MerC domain-containing protein [Sediminibacterium ginsengisoli]SKA19041.1 MerC mercury resistance protein [Sediminibacterium ginsengisoli]
MELPVYKSWGDKAGIWASLICSIHCVLLPFLLSALPVLGIEILHNHVLEAVTIAVSFFAGGWAIRRGYLHYHRNTRVVLFFACGILLLFIANFTKTQLSEAGLKFAGALLLITAHIHNRRQCKKCTKEAGHEGQC